MAYLYQRGKKGTYYLKYYVGGRQKETSLRTNVRQIAEEKRRQFESAQARGVGNPLPTRTPIAEVLQAYAEHIRAHKTPKAAQTDVYYLREAFGPVCPGIGITSRARSAQARKRRPAPRRDGRRKPPVIDAACFEEVTAGDIGAFIDAKVREQGLKPKTANHYRSIIRRVFNWAVETGRVRLPDNTNPASKVRPYRESAPEIRYLTLAQIDEQLRALRFKPQLQCMVAMLIYAGLRREELLWLTLDDVDVRRSPRPGAASSGGVIRVRAKTIEVAGQPRSWQPKTKVNRAVPISAALRAYLDRYTPPASDPASGAEWFFPAPSGGLWDPDNFSADLREANREAGLQWSSLDYRHTFGSHLAQRGVSLYKISTLMGNSPEICRRHYAALVPEALATEIDFCSDELQLQREKVSS